MALAPSYMFYSILNKSLSMSNNIIQNFVHERFLVRNNLQSTHQEQLDTQEKGVYTRIYTCTVF